MAVRHMVWVKFKSETTDAQKRTIAAGLNALQDQIDVIQAIHVGDNFTDRAGGFDFGLLVMLPDRDALTTYLEHPAHQAAAAALKAAAEQVMALDIED